MRADFQQDSYYLASYFNEIDNMSPNEFSNYFANKTVMQRSYSTAARLNHFSNNLQSGPLLPQMLNDPTTIVALSLIPYGRVFRGAVNIGSKLTFAGRTVGAAASRYTRGMKWFYNRNPFKVNDFALGVLGKFLPGAPPTIPSIYGLAPVLPGVGYEIYKHYSK